MACLDYRCSPLMPQMLAAVQRHLKSWRAEALSLLLHSMACLGCGEGPLIFDEVTGERSVDYGDLCHRVAQETGSGEAKYWPLDERKAMENI